MAVGRKQVTFDLDTKSLENYYPSDSWSNAYGVIKRHMLRNGFLWQQGSVYVSSKPMLSRDVLLITEDLVENNPWLNVCMRDCRQTNVGKEHSLNHIFDKDIIIPTREELKKQEAKKNTPHEDGRMTLKGVQEEIAAMKTKVQPRINDHKDRNNNDREER